MPHSIFSWISILLTAALFGYMLYGYVAALRSRPKISKEDIVYQERFASGCSQKNVLTKIGGARRCLRLVVTRDLLWVTSWFPFSLFAALYDLEHVIPLRSISAAQPERSLGSDTVLLSYVDGSGRDHGLRLIPMDRARFLSAIQSDDGKT